MAERRCPAPPPQGSRQGHRHGREDMDVLVAIQGPGREVVGVQGREVVVLGQGLPAHLCHAHLPPGHGLTEPHLAPHHPPPPGTEQGGHVGGQGGTLREVQVQPHLHTLCQGSLQATAGTRPRNQQRGSGHRGTQEARVTFVRVSKVVPCDVDVGEGGVGHPSNFQCTRGSPHGRREVRKWTFIHASWGLRLNTNCQNTRHAPRTPDYI